MTNRSWTAGIVGGVVGSLATAALFVTAGPSLVRKVVVAHPEMLVDAGDALREKQVAPLLASLRTNLETPYHGSWKGAQKPEVVMTYFYDYACGYCRKSNPDIEKLLAEDKGLRVVYRELPILGPDSVAAARVSLAASKAGKFAAYHDTLTALGNPDEKTVTEAAKKAGVAMPPASPDIEAELRANMDMAQRLGATGTPLFVVGNRMFNAAVGYDELKKAIAAARAA